MKRIYCYEVSNFWWQSQRYSSEIERKWFFDLNAMAFSFIVKESKSFTIASR